MGWSTGPGFGPSVAPPRQAALQPLVIKCLLSRRVHSAKLEGLPVSLIITSAKLFRISRAKQLIL